MGSASEIYVDRSPRSEIQRFDDITIEMRERLLIMARDGRSTNAPKRRAAWKAVLDLTATLADVQESVAQLQSLERQ